MVTWVHRTTEELCLSSISSFDELVSKLEDLDDDIETEFPDEKLYEFSVSEDEEGFPYLMVDVSGRPTDEEQSRNEEIDRDEIHSRLIDAIEELQKEAKRNGFEITGVKVNDTTR